MVECVHGTDKRILPLLRISAGWGRNPLDRMRKGSRVSSDSRILLGLSLWAA